jgi:hypothetical protein
LVERLLWEQEVVGSNPATPIGPTRCGGIAASGCFKRAVASRQRRRLGARSADSPRCGTSLGFDREVVFAIADSHRRGSIEARAVRLHSRDDRVCASTRWIASGVG